MSKIYIEVPTNTNETIISVPCGDDELLWQFQIIFTELEYSKIRIISIRDNGCDEGLDWNLASREVTKENYKNVNFEYSMIKDDFEIHIKISVIFGENVRLIKADW